VTKYEYLVEVAWQLRDLPWRKRRELVDDLRRHLDEVPLDRLAPPRKYVAELREAEGLARCHGPVAFLRARRPRNVVLVVLLVVVAALLAAGYAWVQSYQPLVTGFASLDPPDSHSEAEGETVAPFHEGRPFRFGFSIRNDGGFAVRVLGVPLRGNRPFATRLFVSRDLSHARNIPGPLAPFRPFDLEPGQERMLVLRGRFAHCRDWPGGTGVTFDHMPVRFSFLWRTETTSVPLSSPLVIQVPERRDCG
jgi:hypothetical protein